MPRHLWICDFECGYTDESRNRVESHEENCDKNPNNNPIIEEIEVIDEDDDEEDNDYHAIGEYETD
jgi:hypothetical protein